VTPDTAPVLPHLETFLLHLRANGYSPRTVYNYQRDLALFARFLALAGIPFDRVDKLTITRFKAALADPEHVRLLEDRPQKDRLKVRSVNRTLSALRTYLRFLVEIDYPVPVPPDAVKLARAERPHPRVPDLADLLRVLEAPSYLEADPKVALRNRAILEVLFATGMRISELCNLNRNQVGPDGQIFVRGKGKKERFVYLTPRARHHLDRYLATRTDAFPALFIPYRGRRADDRDPRISPNYVEARLRHYLARLKINVPITPHTFRHAFATYLAEEGANPAAIQVLLGHESLQTTNRYVNLADRAAREAHRRFHPLPDPDA